MESKYLLEYRSRERLLLNRKIVIEDEVEIGAGCTIDRGVTAETRIGRGTKMDNMVHIGHDTTVGKNCLFAAQEVLPEEPLLRTE